MYQLPKRAQGELRELAPATDRRGDALVPVPKHVDRQYCIIHTVKLLLSLPRKDVQQNSFQI